ncbi:F-box only protein 17 isoform X1 [Rousettus aegyptiacus]|uniref:F-box only protein 17 isoform X1 n=1 Tax=Rousettus aegyptiacus TaxID=9407 RepID=UPI00168D1A5D|nr:F-box only protein 17 isoform X1 [Rousettus aegyptiacus]XP_036087520.1 F-box only protein 17 isoform X1 [Rousettus aegyptiacus]
MGAWPSRRRLLPPDPPLALDALPPELLVQVLSHVLPCALVTRCRSVCCAWRDVVGGPTVWLLQLARDRSAEGRALYVVAQRCPPNSEEEEFPLCARARYCLLAPLGRSLIFNSCGERSSLEIPRLLPQALAPPPRAPRLLPPEPPADISPYGVGMHGPHQSAGSLTFSLPPSIPETGWMGAVSRLTAQENCIYLLRVRLLDIYEKEVVKFSASPNLVLQWTERGCRQVSHVFTSFGKGIRYVSFERYGRVARAWAGCSGALVTHSSRIRPSRTYCHLPDIIANQGQLYSWEPEDPQGQRGVGGVFPVACSWPAPSEPHFLLLQHSGPHAAPGPRGPTRLLTASPVRGVQGIIETLLCLQIVFSHGCQVAN